MEHFDYQHLKASRELADAVNLQPEQHSRNDSVEMIQTVRLKDLSSHKSASSQIDSIVLSVTILISLASQQIESLQKTVRIRAGKLVLQSHSDCSFI